MGVRVSRGYLRHLIVKVSEALAPAFDELLRALPEQPTLNVDETGHANGGNRLWTWCFKARMYTLFRIDPSRGSQCCLMSWAKNVPGFLGAIILAPTGSICG